MADHPAYCSCASCIQYVAPQDIGKAIRLTSTSIGSAREPALGYFEVGPDGVIRPIARVLP